LDEAASAFWTDDIAEAPQLRPTAPWRSAWSLTVGGHPPAGALHQIAISSVNPSNVVPGTCPVELPIPDSIGTVAKGVAGNIVLIERGKPQSYFNESE
jgi:hypothetical protein